MTKQLITPDTVHPPVMPYSHAAIAGNTIYIAAQLPLDESGRLVGPNDAARQAEQVFQNFKLVLEAAGATLNDVVKLTTFLTSLEHRMAVMEVRNRFFGNHRAPSLLAIVHELPVKGAILEVDGIAVVD